MFKLFNIDFIEFTFLDLVDIFFVTLIIVLGWTALGGVLWEFSEYFYDLLVYANGWSANPVQFGLDDTLGDIAFDLFGGLIVVVMVRLGYHKKRN